MSKKAQERALEAYPVDVIGHTIELAVGAEPKPMDWNENNRKCYTEGYEQAEKDLALTKDDVWCIFNLVGKLQTKYSATEGCLQEVADIFNEQRNK